MKKIPLVTVIKVRDGDTIELSDGRVVRYIGVDTPELKINECYSSKSAQINKNLVLNKKVRVETDINILDNFGRTLAYVYLTNNDNVQQKMVNQELLENGSGRFFLDTVNVKYQKKFVAAANRAHRDKRGLWSACVPNKQTSCIIKGNSDMNDKRWYHLPGFRHYAQVVMNLEKGDRWFCTEKEAGSAGFTRARE